MSIENNLASIAKSLESIAKVMESRESYATPVVAAAQPAPVIPAVVEVAAPLVPPVPASAPLANPAPLPPVVGAPAPVMTGNTPFTDAKGLIGYVMNTYKEMGPEKGAKIQDVLSGIGYQNINDVKPESYGALYAGIEALK